jgi:hypothetical protein
MVKIMGDIVQIAATASLSLVMITGAIAFSIYIYKEITGNNDD